jgi:hypothetical protein
LREADVARSTLQALGVTALVLAGLGAYTALTVAGHRSNALDVALPVVCIGVGVVGGLVSGRWRDAVGIALLGVFWAWLMGEVSRQIDPGLPQPEVTLPGLIVGAAVYGAFFLLGAAVGVAVRHLRLPSGHV